MMFAIALLIIHLFISAFFSVKIWKTNVLASKQKFWNIMLLFVIPVIWPVLIFYLLKKQPGSHEVAVKNDISTNGFHESGIAINNYH